MMPKQLNILNSVGEIIEERNKDTLEVVFVKSLSTYIKCKSLLFIKVFNYHSNLELQLKSVLPNNDCVPSYTHLIATQHNPTLCLRADPHHLSSIQTKQVQTIDIPEGLRLIYPIVLNDAVISLLDINTPNFDAHEDSLIKGFIDIYQNFLAVIYDNEHDTLTGLLNRKTFDEKLSTFLNKDPQESSNHSVVDHNQRTTHSNTGHFIGVLDIDHFKRINDGFGHIYGDEVLLLFSNLMKKIFRQSDILFRFGGEEFIVFLLNTTLEDALKTFNRFRHELELFEFSQIGQITVSIGVSAVDPNLHSTHLIEQADQALYYAKDNGRNQVCYYHQLIQDRKLSSREINDDIDLF